jgi:glycosyltransferase involved in cell wall biosynthesis
MLVLDKLLNILVIGYVWPEPNSSAAGKNMLSLIRSFVAKGHTVTFVTAATDSVHKADLTALGVNCETVALNCSSFNQQLLQFAPQVVVFDRYMTQEQFAWRVKETCPDALHILNTEDLHSLRHARFEAVKRENDATKAHLNTALAQREIGAILRSDVTLVISSAEYQLLTHVYRVPESQLYYFPLDAGKPLESPPSFEERQDLVTIGNFRHAPNWDAVLQLKAMWPAIRKAFPSVNMKVYGAYPPKKATQLHNPKQGFYVEGWAEDADNVIAQARLLLAPIRFGAGIKGKLLDAMRCNTPTLTTDMGAEGLLPSFDPNESDEHNPLWGGALLPTPCEKDSQIQPWINAIAALYHHQDQWQAAVEKGQALLSSYQKDVQPSAFINHVENLHQRLAAHRDSLFFHGLLWQQSLNASKYMSQWIEAKNRV